MHRSAAWLALLLPAAAPAAPLDGTWEITALIDDGDLVPPSAVRERFAEGGRVTIAGQTVRLVRPGSRQVRELIFTTDATKSPKTIDLSGAEKTGSKGVYLAEGDTLLLCLAGPGSDARPAGFTSVKGSHALLMTLARAKGAAPAVPAKPVSFPEVLTPDPRPVPVPATAPVPPSVASDADLARQLVGTWGHQDDERVEMATFNADGTFSSTRTYKKPFARIFHHEVRSSGTWKVRDGVLIAAITASTDADFRGQVYSYRITSLGPTELVSIDQRGWARREWRVR